jgi:hypothetical protein
MSEFIKIILLLAILTFFFPIALWITLWCLSSIASGNIFPFFFCLIIALYFIGKH